MAPSDNERFFFSLHKEHYDYTKEWNVLQNFVRLAQKQHWELGSPQWRTNWKSCFGRIYTNDQNPYVPIMHSGRRFKDCVQNYNQETAQDDRKEDRKEEFDQIREGIMFRGWSAKS
ncbi:hypothetical protein GTA08_BOTSDO10576 [Botryosphaeria dothidea]|uniref:Uncharacterized protein n=1 Tax=Botryosphaeria dothidea TaxID=55169 RepID=A0A8H4IIF5_9PEZI|nr:hypothetical protein GTA08_BOTSDO10576 [Botryosphaeria dothidea]